jgi:hypothetical protein
VLFASGTFRVWRSDVLFASGTFRVRRSDVLFASGTFRVWRSDVLFASGACVWVCVCVFVKIGLCVFFVGFLIA